MKKFFWVYLFFNLLTTISYAQSKYPVDISYMVTDFKYSKKDGLKICEVQQGSLSALKGDLCVAGGDGTIAPAIAQYFKKFTIPKWTTGLIYAPIKRALAKQSWSIIASFANLLRNQDFLDQASTNPNNPYSINSYSGMVYADVDVTKKYDEYQESYPGMLFLNAATFPYWIDKYKMSELFNRNEKLKQYKADWRLYPKNYLPNLAQQIQDDMPADMYVIKPRKEFLGNGVIIVARENLDSVLQTILEISPALKKHADKKYAYWANNKDTTFLIETYYESDYLCFDHPLENASAPAGNYHYDTTMRIAFILEYNEGVVSYHSLGGFCKLPCKSLEEDAPLQESRISYHRAPFYQPIDPELFTEINEHMQRAMLLLYEVMLQA